MREFDAQQLEQHLKENNSRPQPGFYLEQAGFDNVTNLRAALIPGLKLLIRIWLPTRLTGLLH